jgi:prepilin-type N-terminal cleavage/methylation domain-containing protein
MRKDCKLGFSLLEVSVVLLIIGILLASISAGKSMIQSSRITAAKSLTANSPVSSIDGLVIWLEPVLAESIDEDETYEGQEITGWQNITNYYNTSELLVKTDAPKYAEKSINSLPSIRFDGDDDIDIESALKNIASRNFSIFIVEDRANTGIDDILINATDLIIQYTATNKFSIKQGGTTFATAALQDFNPTINYISFEKNTASNTTITEYYRNKMVTDSSTPNVSSTATNFVSTFTGATLGDSSNGFNGDISEVIIYNKALDETEAAEVLKYLSSKYKITLTQ